MKTTKMDIKAGVHMHGVMAIFEMAVILKIFTKVVTNYISVESL
jgi:hypothetical protein